MKAIKTGSELAQNNVQLSVSNTHSKRGLQRFKCLFIFLFIIMVGKYQNNVYAANGDSCQVAISNPLQEGYGVTQTEYKKWFVFYATDTVATLNLQSELNALPDSVIIYKGSCDSLIQYSAYEVDSENCKLISVPIDEIYLVCFLSSARNCTSCLMSPLVYNFRLVEGDAKTIRLNSCINPVPDCEYICNGSFEFRASCPNESGQLTHANSWINVLETPEYFNSCRGICPDPLAVNVYQLPSSTYTIKPKCISVPINFAGTQSPSMNADGNSAYAGIIAAGGGPDGAIDYAEYIGQQLNQPLQVGVTYSFSMDISWAEVSRYQAKDFGVYLSSGSVNFNTFITNEPQILFTNFITNSSSWTTLTGTFTPTVSGLNKFYFGLFPNSTAAVAPSVINADPPNQTDLPAGLDDSRWAYYYVDNFSLKVAKSEEHIDIKVCPSWETLGQFEPIEANLVIPNMYTNINWDVTSGLTINPVSSGLEPYTATYIGTPITITAHAYIGNCPIDLFFHIDFEDLCECEAFDCTPGQPPSQNNSNSINLCFYTTNFNVFQYITGIVTLTNSNVEYSNSFLKMGPYASIIIPNGKTLTINNSTLFACKTMWTGIVVKAGGTIIINNSRIEDALKAIEVQAGATVIINGAYFNKNYVGVLIESGAGSNEFTADKMNFSCSSTGSPTSGNLLLIPHSGEHGFAGIKVIESPYLKIGNMTSIGNTFIETLYGIYAEKSNLEVENNVFNDLFYDNTDPNSSSGIYTIECDLVVGDLNTSITYNHFSKMRYGINANYFAGAPLIQHVFLVRSNEFENYNSPETPFEKCIAVNGGFISDFEIANNKLESFKKGISLFGSNAIGDIKYNQLDGYSFSSLAVYQSIAAITVSNPLFSKIFIFENSINQNKDHSCNTGISLLSTASSSPFIAEVSQNLIYKCRTGINCVGFKPNTLIIKDHDPNLGAGIYLEQKGFIQKGIQLSACSQALVKNNYVKAATGSGIPNANLEYRVFGIFVNGFCANTTVSENYFWRLGTGMYYTGGYTNLPLTVNCNRMIQNVNGVNITTTSLGDQGDDGIISGIIAVQDNQWSIPNGAAYMGAKVNIASGQYPTWFSRSASLPFFPNSITKMFPIDCIKSNPNFLLPNAVYNCSFGCPHPPCQHFRIYEMANNESPYDIMSDDELGNVKLALLYQLKNDSLLLDSLLNVGGVISTFVNSLLLTDENKLANSAKLFSERDTIGGLAALATVNASTDPRANQVTVSEIFARTWARGLEVTQPQDSTTLMQIACMEPQYGGLAVFDAMALINWDTCGYYNYNNDRNGTSQTTFSVNNNFLTNTQSQIKLYPNPTHDNITIEFLENFDVVSFEVTNIAGIKVNCKVLVKNNTLLLEAISLSKGYYLIKLINNKGEIVNLNFIKQ